MSDRRSVQLPVSLTQDFRGKGSSLVNIFGFYKTRHILLSDSANCTVTHAVVLSFDTIPACDRRTDGQTDRQTDGIAVASTAPSLQCEHCGAL